MTLCLKSKSAKKFQLTAARRRLGARCKSSSPSTPFQLTAARRRLGVYRPNLRRIFKVSTHSRPKAAGPSNPLNGLRILSFNSQPPEGGWKISDGLRRGGRVSTHSRPKAAGITASNIHPSKQVSTHSRPKAAGDAIVLEYLESKVSTHSRPKAAGNPHIARMGITIVSTHSRPKAAGCAAIFTTINHAFQLTAARRRLDHSRTSAPVN